MIKEMWHDEPILLIAACFVILLIGVIILAGVAQVKSQQRLMKQCLADNLPEYECYAKIIQGRR